uniref:Sialate O-acetylesterase domain-containing protein n=1 Tax=Ochrobactrum phage ORM_20 TaxID=2985243 RepID=A0A9N6WWQ9_9VIRU|nr:hypothetical protein ORM20_00137 [Ochrobactrum phage ORM_20]
MAARAQIYYVIRGSYDAPSGVYDTVILEEGQTSAPAQAKYKSAVIIPMDVDIYFTSGIVPNITDPTKRVLVPLGSRMEIQINQNTRFQIMASGTNAGADAAAFAVPKDILWEDIKEKPLVIASGDTIEEARNSIGAATNAPASEIAPGLMSPADFVKLRDMTPGDDYQDQIDTLKTDVAANKADIVSIGNDIDVINQDTTDLAARILVNEGDIAALKDVDVSYETRISNVETATSTNATSIEGLSNSLGTTDIAAQEALTKANANAAAIAPIKEKTDGIEAGATKNQTDSYLRNRANHTGSQPISSVTNLQTSLDALDTKATNAAAAASSADTKATNAATAAANADTKAQSAVTGLAGKFDKPTGTATQYLDGTGAPKDFPTPPEEEKKPIFIFVSGQSNAQLIADIDSADPDIVYSPRLKIWYSNWEDIVPTDFQVLDPRKTSLAQAYGNYVAEMNPDRDVYVLNCGYGGTSITAWNSNVPIAAGTNIKTNMDNFVAHLGTLGVTDVVFDEFLWWQGETDADNFMPENLYWLNFDGWLASYDDSKVFNRFTKTKIFTLAGGSRVASIGYAEMNRILMNVIGRLGGSAGLVNTTQTPASLWDAADPVHMNGNGYITAAKMAYHSSPVGRINPAFLWDNQTNETTFVSGKGIEFPYSAVFDPPKATPSQSTLDTFTTNYLSSELTVVGGTTAGTCTYTHRGAPITRYSYCINGTVTIVWDGHTGTGQLTIRGALNIPNVMAGQSLPFLGIYRDADDKQYQVMVALKPWENDFLVYKVDGTTGELTPLEVSAKGAINFSYTAHRLPG